MSNVQPLELSGRLWLNREGHGYLGAGRIALLERIGETGSIAQAARSMGMSYKAVRTERHKLIHWINRDGMDELYDLEPDPYELVNVIGDPRYALVARELRAELARLVVVALGL